MKFWKICIIMIGVLILILSSTSASAITETDATGDVYHWKMVDSAWSWEPSTLPKAHIDITELTYTVNGNQITISMKVAGNAQISENVAYMAWINTSDATYNMYLINDQKFVMAMGIDGGGLPAMNTDVTVSGNTISGTIELVGTDKTIMEFWGYAWEYTEYGAANQEWWGDWIPGTNPPNWDQEGDGEGDGGDTNDEGDTNGEGSGNGGNGSGTPGFEAVAVITALAVAIIILRRRK
jgi:PGF-CTERM protein